ncbi:MAG: DnaJ domain-containing protein [Desulfopila sp.]|jgi:DnaJ-class molecular chaperone|nr:DnaJ domain-containing protein [Desulfopila sp.]
MPKNYYVILGIPADSSLQDIKTAYRRLAKEYHPDYFGPQGSPFPAIQEAYAVLSNPQRRREYDDTLRTVRSNKREGGIFRPQAAQHDNSVEPLIPEEQSAESLRFQQSSHLRQPGPDSGTFFDRFFTLAADNWNYTRPFQNNLDIAVILTAEQADRGGHIRLRLPARIHCPECLGRGYWGVYECGRCFGTGSLQGEMPLVLNYPAGIADNHIVQFPLRRYGIPGHTLNVRFMIDEDLP